MRQAVIVSYARTGLAKAVRGGFNNTSNMAILGHAIQHAVQRAGVDPKEVEDVVASCPGVMECAVIGVPDENSGETVKLFVVKKDPALTIEIVKAHCRENLTGYKNPKTIVFRDALPKSNVGKILRRELRDADKAG